MRKCSTRSLAGPSVGVLRRGEYQREREYPEDGFCDHGTAGPAKTEDRRREADHGDGVCQRAPQPVPNA